MLARMSRIVLLSLLLACSPSKTNSESNESNEAPTTPVATAPALEQAAASAPEVPKTEGQSFQDGMQLICDSLEHIEQNLDPSEKQKAVATWIGENVTNTQVRELFSIMGDVQPRQRAGMMKAAAAKAGITKCPIADQ
tara:strand:- start:143 stop:556 length:414 start_codon:yes stop_codon:yes gene_type:complete